MTDEVSSRDKPEPRLPLTPMNIADAAGALWRSFKETAPIYYAAVALLVCSSSLKIGGKALISFEAPARLAWSLGSIALGATIALTACDLRDYLKERRRIVGGLAEGWSWEELHQLPSRRHRRPKP